MSGYQIQRSGILRLIGYTHDRIPHDSTTTGYVYNEESLLSLFSTHVLSWCVGLLSLANTGRFSEGPGLMDGAIGILLQF